MTYYVCVLRPFHHNFVYIFVLSMCCAYLIILYFVTMKSQVKSTNCEGILCIFF
jgi:hypothetical protein